MDDKIKAAYALNLWTVSVAQIIDYNDVYVLEQEYDNIMNNLNLEHMPKDEALLEIIKEILDQITYLRMDEGDKAMLEKRYQHQLKNAVWSAVPNVGAIFATSDPIALGITLATQVGIGYMNYRRNKAEHKIANEESQWEIQKHHMQHLHSLQNQLFETAWRMADEYQFPDEYRLTANQIKQYNDALMESNLVRRYSKLDGMRRHFAAYPAFWYHMGSTANCIFRSYLFEGDYDSQSYYRSCAIESFEKYKQLNQFNLLRNDVLTASWALEYLELLDLNFENSSANARELIEIAEQHSGNKLDVLELCAFAYLRIRDEENAARLLHILVNNGYNEEINAQILSGLYIKKMRSQDSGEAMLAKVHYNQLVHITDKAYILDIPHADCDLSQWKPAWKREESFETFVETCINESEVTSTEADNPLSDALRSVDELVRLSKEWFLKCQTEILNSRLKYLCQEDTFYKSEKEFSKAELIEVLRQMTGAEENETDVLGLLNADVFKPLHDKHSGILFMKNGFYFKQKPSSTPRYMAYSDIRYVKTKFATLIIKSKTDTIIMKGVSFSASYVSDIFLDMRRLYNEL